MSDPGDELLSREALLAGDPGRGDPSRFWLAVWGVLIVGACLFAAGVFGVTVAVTVPNLAEAAAQERCRTNLRTLGLAAITYSGDKRFFPHVRNIRDHDGDATTGDASRTVRALYAYGYLDSPETLVCPSSDDAAAATTVTDPARWFWGGGSTPMAGVSPFTDGLDDPTLLEADELSYGWTRRGLSSGGARTIDVVAADRSLRQAKLAGLAPGERGNHADGAFVVYADASVQLVDAEGFPRLLIRTETGPMALIDPRR